MVVYIVVVQEQGKDFTYIHSVWNTRRRAEEEIDYLDRVVWHGNGKYVAWNEANQACVEEHEVLT